MLTVKTFLRKTAWLLFGLACLIAVPALASADNSATQSVTQGYGSDTALQNGLIVKLKDSDATKVEPDTVAAMTKMQGVVVAASDASVTLSNNDNKKQVYVATFGRYSTLVSNQNGPIKTGDYVTISSLAGVGMKADSSQAIILGKAAGNFDGTSNVEGTATLKDTAGKQVAVSLGRIPVDIGVAHNPLQQTIDNNLPGFLRRASQIIANKPVSSTRVYLSLAVLLISAIIAGSMLYAGIRNGLIAIGRNPLAKLSITRNIVQVIVTSLIIFIIGLFGVYLILKL
jgi:hypothetical protein